jgi:hypothetical protein
MDEVTRKITHQGSPARVGALVQMLEAEGVRVDWSPPHEERGLGTDINGVIVNLVSTGTVVAIAAAVKKFREWAPRCRVEVEDEDEGADGNEPKQ